MAVSIFIKMPDASGIKGETQQEGYAECIAAQSLQWGVGVGVTGGFGNAQRETSLPSFSEMVFTKSFDSASNDIATCCSRGFSLDLVKIHFVKNAGEGVLEYLTYELTNAIISGYSVSSGGETPTESISLNYTKIKSKYTAQATDHSAATPHEFEYDIAKQK